MNVSCIFKQHLLFSCKGKQKFVTEFQHIAGKAFFFMLVVAYYFQVKKSNSTNSVLLSNPLALLHHRANAMGKMGYFVRLLTYWHVHVLCQPDDWFYLPKSSPPLLNLFLQQGKGFVLVETIQTRTVWSLKSWFSKDSQLSQCKLWWHQWVCH